VPSDGDGHSQSIAVTVGFLFSAAELETAVRLKQNIVHMVWIDSSCLHKLA
jgi:hypothetical protein